MHQQDEMAQVMQEMEQRLEIALDNMEFGTDLAQDDIDVIRAACGKPKKNVVLKELFNDFGTIFGGAK
jgi:hypothetical protein